MMNVTEPLGFVLVGLLLGMRHATDPDHVVAITTFISQERKVGSAARIGLLWGLGHSATVLAVGSLIIAFRVTIPLRLGLAMEFGVALVLIGLGAAATGTFVRDLAARLGLLSRRRQTPRRVHSHPHAHGSLTHSHTHLHLNHAGLSDDDRHGDHRIASTPRIGQRRRIKIIAVGLVHGLAGSAAIALLVLSTIPSPRWAMLYLGVFCLGTVLGMGFITAMIGLPVTWASARIDGCRHVIVTGTALLSFGFGLLLAWQTGVSGHLFGMAPIWTPQ